MTRDNKNSVEYHIFKKQYDAFEVMGYPKHALETLYRDAVKTYYDNREVDDVIRKQARNRFLLTRVLPAAILMGAGICGALNWVANAGYLDTTIITTPTPEQPIGDLYQQSPLVEMIKIYATHYANQIL